MKNRIAVALLALTINVVEDHKPHQLTNAIHPNVLINYMELHRKEVHEFDEMISLFNLYWKYIKGGIIPNHLFWYCRLLNDAHNILFDEYYKDPKMFDAVKPILIEYQNKMYPNEPIDDLDPDAPPIFNIHLQTNPKVFCPPEIEGTKPHTYLKKIDSETLIKYMESHADMKDMLVLFKLYWERKKVNGCTNDFELYCDLLLDAFNIVFDIHFRNVKNIEQAIIPKNKKQDITGAEKVNSYLQYASML